VDVDVGGGRFVGGVSRVGGRSGVAVRTAGEARRWTTGVDAEYGKRGDARIRLQPSMRACMERETQQIDMAES
jgi:hypothetical protein